MTPILLLPFQVVMAVVTLLIVPAAADADAAGVDYGMAALLSSSCPYYKQSRIF